MTEATRQPIYIDIFLHRTIKIMAAEQSTSMKSLTERLLRLGMVAGELTQLIKDAAGISSASKPLTCPWCDRFRDLAAGHLIHLEDCPASLALAAYQAALDGKETA